MDKDNIRTGIGFILFVVLIISLFNFTARFIRKINKKTKGIEQRISESKKVVAGTQQIERKDSLQDLRKSIGALNKAPLETGNTRALFDQKVARKILSSSTNVQSIKIKSTDTGVSCEITFESQVLDFGAKTYVKEACEALVTIYGGGWVDVKGYKGFIKVATAEYSPFTQRIVVK